MNRIFILMILLSFFSCNRSGKKIVSKWDNGKDKVVLTYNNLSDTLTYVKEDFYKNGQTYSKGMYINGKQEGIWKWWYYDGNKKDEAIFDRGNYVVQKKHWYENGNLSQLEIISGPLLNDCNCFDGHVTNYYENGSIEDETTFLNGKEDGKYICKYDNGQAKKQEYFKAGIKEGDYNEWYKTGVQWVKGTYKNDKQDSVWIWFDSTGKKQSVQLFKNGEAMD